MFEVIGYDDGEFGGWVFGTYDEAQEFITMKYKELSEGDYWTRYYVQGHEGEQ